MHAVPFVSNKNQNMCMLLHNNHNKELCKVVKILYDMYVTSAERAQPPRLLSNSPAEGDKRACTLPRLSY